MNASTMIASEHLPVILDLRAQLTDRAHRAKALIEYIGANGLLGRLSQTCRRRLSWNAERLAAGLALWRHRNTNAQ
jgi:nuclear pore complex protein Nup133